jgi:hypothetical protein
MNFTGHPSRNLYDTILFSMVVMVIIWVDVHTFHMSRVPAASASKTIRI